MIYDHQGWHGDRFLYADKLLGAVEERVNLDNSSARLAAGIRRYKSLERWTSLSDSLFSQGGESRGFILLAAFAAPLMGFGEGVSVSVITKDTTQAPMLFAGIHSIYGRQKTLHIAKSMPFQTKFDTLRACGHLPCVYPDLYHADPSVTDKFIEAAIAQGTVLLGTSSDWLPRQVAHRLGERGDERRVLEIVLPPSNAAEDQELLSTYHNNFGHAGLEYVRYLSQNVSYFRQAIEVYRKSVHQRLGGREDERLLINVIACVGMAAKVVSHLGLLHVTAERMVKHGGELLEVMRSRDYEVVHLPEKMLEEYMMDRRDATLVMDGTALSRARDQVHYDGVAETEIRYEVLNRRIFVSREKFHAWCKGRFQSGHNLVRKMLRSGIAKKREVLRGLRSSHPEVNLRPNPRIATFEVDPDHPLINAAVRRWQRELGVSLVLRQEPPLGAEVASRTPAPSTAAPPESD